MSETMQLRALLLSNRTRDREKYLRRGAAINDPVFVLLYAEELNKETYIKIHVDMAGQVAGTTAPVGLILGTKNWRIWDLRGEDNKHIYVAYNPKAHTFNPYWETLRKTHADGANVLPQMKGALVAFRLERSLDWSEPQLQRELLNWLVAHYVTKTTYKFSAD